MKKGPRKPVKTGEAMHLATQRADPQRNPILAEGDIARLRRPKGDPARYGKHGGKIEHDGKRAKSVPP